MLLAYIYLVIWLFAWYMNVIGIILGVIAAIYVGIVLAKTKNNGFYKIGVPFLVFMGVTHLFYIVGTLVVSVTDEDIEVKSATKRKLNIDQLKVK